MDRWKSMKLRMVLIIIYHLFIYHYYLDEVCDEIEEEDWNYCYNLTMDKCASNDSSVCDKKCKWIRCNYFIGQNANNFSLCVPADLPASNKTDDICVTNIGNKPLILIFLLIISLNSQILIKA